MADLPEAGKTVLNPEESEKLYGADGRPTDTRINQLLERQGFKVPDPPKEAVKEPEKPEEEPPKPAETPAEGEAPPKEPEQTPKTEEKPPEPKPNFLEDILINQKKEEMQKKLEQEQAEARQKKLESLSGEERIEYLAAETKKDAEIMALKADRFIDKTNQVFEKLLSDMPKEERELLEPVIAERIQSNTYDEAFEKDIPADKVAAAIVAEAKGIKQEDIFALRSKQAEEKRKTEEKIQSLKDFSGDKAKAPEVKAENAELQQLKAKAVKYNYLTPEENMRLIKLRRASQDKGGAQK